MKQKGMLFGASVLCLSARAGLLGQHNAWKAVPVRVAVAERRKGRVQSQDAFSRRRESHCAIDPRTLRGRP